jgi:DNA-binding IclR family transcriptional regulator
MKRKHSGAARDEQSSDVREPARGFGAQTLVRGLDVLEAVASGATNLGLLAETLKLNRSTAHRLALTLVEHRYLSFVPRVGYALGPALLKLGFLARAQMSLPRVARDHIESLAAATGDTVHLGILDGERALYLDKIPSSRRVEIRSRIGERHPLRSTGLGKALILDETEPQWRERYQYDSRNGQKYKVTIGAWVRRMTDYSRQGFAFDLEENEDRIRCVAAPIRDVTDKIVGAISVSSAAQYMDDNRMNALAAEVVKAAAAISRDLGGGDEVRPNSRARKRS